MQNAETCVKIPDTPEFYVYSISPDLKVELCSKYSCKESIGMRIRNKRDISDLMVIHVDASVTRVVWTPDSKNIEITVNYSLGVFCGSPFDEVFEYQFINEQWIFISKCRRYLMIEDTEDW